MLLVLLKHVRPLLVHRRGAAALEFAILAPLLFAMLLGTIEYGFVFYGYSVMQQSANQVARAVAVNSLPPAQAQTLFNSLMPSWVKGTSITVSRTNAAEPTKSYVLLRATATASQVTPVHMFTSAIPLTLTADISVKEELPYDS